MEGYAAESASMSGQWRARMAVPWSRHLRPDMIRLYSGLGFIGESCGGFTGGNHDERREKGDIEAVYRIGKTYSQDAWREKEVEGKSRKREAAIKYKMPYARS